MKILSQTQRNSRKAKLVSLSPLTRLFPSLAQIGPGARAAVIPCYYAARTTGKRRTQTSLDSPRKTASRGPAALSTHESQSKTPQALEEPHQCWDLDSEVTLISATGTWVRRKTMRVA
ncbi:uncharacterized protein BO72DRAFT_276862 [Aspergillus fijiensis CBS 313.89]|uniref:Uncharacterized protein n=1 Tax=Aspergillus fijiensis CBS 313.89 TaxID=1448319 RepID=A0A8G1RFM1_9EURO|nr:uncharacterized protein BO72DRAFT_276862 [Aspergillus fijiensis CBS 313.89]RAK72440.1 hypothetical protein BO72DRAFT_276862 [Aspergillus fijiensis CBS 313.89]